MNTTAPAPAKQRFGFKPAIKPVRAAGDDVALAEPPLKAAAEPAPPAPPVGLPPVAAPGPEPRWRPMGSVPQHPGAVLELTVDGVLAIKAIWWRTRQRGPRGWEMVEFWAHPATRKEIEAKPWTGWRPAES